MRERAKREIAPEELSIFCEQVALMLGAGMALYDGIEALSLGYRESADYPMYRKMCESVSCGATLCDALKQAGRFPGYMIEMIAIGERTGKLETVMKGLAQYYMRESRIKRSVASAVTYPMVLGVMMACVIAVLITQVLPIFDQVLASMGMDMTASGNSLMMFGMNVGWAMLAIVGILLCAVLATVLLLKTRYRARVMAIVRRVIPRIDTLSKRISASRVASVLSMMLESGFPMEDALEVMPSILTDETAREKLETVSRDVRAGKPFPDAIDNTGLFDELYSRMIRMGYASGQTDSVMMKIAGIYEDEVNDGISSLISIIEPSIVAVLSVVIGAILLSVMLPMAGMIASVM